LLGLSVFRVVKSLDPQVIATIKAMENTQAYRERNIVGVVVTNRETFVNVAMPFADFISVELGETTTGFAVLGPNQEVVARAKTLAEAEAIAKDAKITIDVKVTRGAKDVDGTVPD
jgi:hypothetical protein